MSKGLLKAQTYRLRWNNDLSSGLDLSEEFRALRKNSDFFDASLCCAVNTGGTSSLRAHKIILSAYSGVFREMFRQNPNKLDPFVYLKGISFSNLSNLLDFMYNGEANVEQTNLNAFLALAEELQVKGLQLINKDVTSTEKVRDAPIKTSLATPTLQSLRNSLLQQQHSRFQRNPVMKQHVTNGYKDYKKEIDDDYAVNAKKRRQFIKKETTTPSRLEEEDDWIPKDFNPSSIYQGGEDYFEKCDGSLATTLGYDPIGMEQPKDTLKTMQKIKTKREPVMEEEEEGNDEPIPEGKIGQVEDFIKNIASKKEGSKSRTMGRCRICLKEMRRDKIKKHIVRTHSQYLDSSSANLGSNDISDSRQAEFISMTNGDLPVEI